MPVRLKPNQVEVGRGTYVDGPIVTVDAIWAGIRDDVTVRFDRRTLRKVWEVDSGNFCLGRAINDDYLTVGGRSGGVRSTQDGRLLWSAPTRFMGIGLWNGRTMVDSRTGLELRDVRTGEVLSTLEIPGGYDSRHLTYGDVVIVQLARMVKAFDLSLSRIQWERPLVDEMEERLPARTQSGALAIGAGTRPGVLIVFHGGSTLAVSAADGSILWHAGVWSPYASPVIHEERVYAACLERFRAIDEATGAIVYDVAHPELKDAFRDKTGTVYKGRMAVAHESGHLAIFNLADGALVTVHRAKVPLWRTAEADGRLLVATEHGTLLVFDESIWG